MKNNYVKFLTIFISLGVIGVLFLWATLLKKDFPLPPPLDNPEAEYVIQKQNNNYVLTYRFKKENSQWIIGSSPVKLDEFVNRQVQIKGYFPRNPVDNSYIFSNLQCIAGECHTLFKKFFGQKADTLVVNIDEVVFSQE